MIVIDSHLHVWDLERVEYPWLGPQAGPLHRSFLPPEAGEQLRANGVGAAVLVQAADSEAETRYLLEVAGSATAGLEVVGVVGWVRLDEPAVASRQLDEYGDRLCGLRHLVHDDPRDDFLELPTVRRSLNLAAARGLAYDIPDAWPRHLGRIGNLADAVPALSIVVDHLGKPPRAGDDPALAAWAAAIRDAARRPNVAVKLSGLQIPGAPLTGEAVRPAFEIALDAFGPDRLMYGGDWPMTVTAGGYAAHLAVVAELIAELSPSERDAVLHATAARVYGLR